MTRRSTLRQRRAELAGAAMGRLANRAMSRRTNGIDGLAKRLLSRQIGPVDVDPELDHPDDWDRPVD